MTITFVYGFNLGFVMHLVEGIALILTYAMLILSSRTQKRENKSYQLLRNAGILGIILSILPITAPLLYCLNCSASEIIVANIYGFTITILPKTPMLFCLGVSLYLVGNRNKEIYGKILIVSGILWVVAFFGYAVGYAAILFGIWMLATLSILSYFVIPALILMIVHGIKFKDKYFVLAGFFYFLSWSSILIALLPIPLI